MDILLAILSHDISILQRTRAKDLLLNRMLAVLCGCIEVAAAAGVLPFDGPGSIGGAW